jgi:hypothetical protein
MKRSPVARVRAHAPKLKQDTDASADLERKLGQAFRDQESDICDLLTMANIANDLDNEGQRIFAVDHLCGMIDEFKQNWYDSIKKASGKARVGDEDGGAA